MTKSESSFIELDRRIRTVTTKIEAVEKEIAKSEAHSDELGKEFDDLTARAERELDADDFYEIFGCYPADPGRGREPAGLKILGIDRAAGPGRKVVSIARRMTIDELVEHLSDRRPFRITFDPVLEKQIEIEDLEAQLDKRIDERDELARVSP